MIDQTTRTSSSSEQKSANKKIEGTIIEKPVKVPSSFLKLFIILPAPRIARVLSALSA